MNELDRASPLPLWAQLEAALRARILAREFESRFPTDEQLVREYAVSRHTAREAIRRLQLTGLVKRERGRGSHVSPAPVALEQPLSRFYSLAASIHERGLEERSSVLALVTGTNTDAALRLGLAEGHPLVHLRRLRFAGAEPLALDDSWLPASIGASLRREELEEGSLYEQLALRAGTPVTGGTERIRAAVVDSETRALLAAPRGQAMLLLERLAFSDGRPIEWRQSRIRGDRFAFISEWTRSA